MWMLAQMQDAGGWDYRMWLSIAVMVTVVLILLMAGLAALLGREVPDEPPSGE